MNSIVGILLLVVGAGLVTIAIPKQGVTRAFMKGTFIEMLYPVLCLGALIIGASILIADLLSWQS